MEADNLLWYILKGAAERSGRKGVQLLKTECELNLLLSVQHLAPPHHTCAWSLPYPLSKYHEGFRIFPASSVTGEDSLELMKT